MEGPGSGCSDGDPKVDPNAGGAAVAQSILEDDHVVAETLAEYDRRPEAEGHHEDGAAGLDSAATAALIDVASGLESLGSKQDELKELFEARIRSDEVQAKALERLHDQLRDYKANFIRQEMLPLLRDLIFCYDFAADEHERARREGPPPTAQETARAFDHLRQMVADVLAKYDVEPYRVGGLDFDRREQQCVRTVPTGFEANEKKIAVVGAIGFRLADQIVRKEQVTVYKFTPGLAATSDRT
jgi:molecular chaperone GrpE (heat shock protein)